MSKQVRSPAEFIRQYKPEPGTYAERLATLLYQAKQEHPYRFFDVPNCAKIALGLSKVPGEKSKDLERFKGLIGNANDKMKKMYGCEIVTDRVDGLRCNVDADDLIETNLRRQGRRVKQAVVRFKETNDMIDTSKVKNVELKKELTASRRSILALDTALTGLPLLKPKSSEK